MPPLRNHCLRAAGRFGVRLAPRLAVALAVWGSLASCGGSSTSSMFLREHPNPAIPGQIVYESGCRILCERCLTVVAASGLTPEVQATCDLPSRPIEVLWIDATSVGFLVQPAGRYIGPDRVEPEQQLNSVNIATHEIAETDVFGHMEYVAVNYQAVSLGGEVASVDQNAGRLFVGGEEIARLNVGGDGYVHQPKWSPDGRWLLVGLTPDEGDADELWVVSRDGKVKGLVAKDYLGGAAWYIDGMGSRPRFIQWHARTEPR
jgi:hypothetical protein